MNTEEILAKELPDFVGNKTADDITNNDKIQALNKAVSKVQEAIRVLYYINEGFNVIDKDKMTETLLALGEFNTVVDNRVRKIINDRMTTNLLALDDRIKKLEKHQ